MKIRPFFPFEDALLFKEASHKSCAKRHISHIHSLLSKASKLCIPSTCYKHSIGADKKWYRLACKSSITWNLNQYSNLHRYFAAATTRCRCQKIRSVFIVLGTYNFAKLPHSHLAFSSSPYYTYTYILHIPHSHTHTYAGWIFRITNAFETHSSEEWNSFVKGWPNQKEASKSKL